MKEDRDSSQASEAHQVGAWRWLCIYRNRLEVCLHEKLEAPLCRAERSLEVAGLTRAGSFENLCHLAKAAFLREHERRVACTIAEIDVGAGIDKILEHGGMTLAAVAQHDRLDQRGPSKIVDMIERRTSRDQRSHDFDVAEMRSRNQGGALIWTGYVVGAASSVKRDPEHR